MGNHEHKIRYASLLCALSYVIGFSILLTMFPNAIASASSQWQVIQLYPGMMQLWFFIIYIIFGIALLLLTISLKNFYNDANPTLKNLFFASGIIWSSYVIACGMIINIAIDVLVVNPDASFSNRDTMMAWHTLYIVQNGLGGGVELIGGLWLLLAIWLFKQSHQLPLFIFALTALSGAAGIATVIPAFKSFGALFGLGQLIWFIWLSLVLLRSRSTAGGKIS